MEVNFYQTLHGQTLPRVLDGIEAEIKSLKGRIKVEEKKGRFEVGRMDGIYKSQIADLEAMAEYIAGDRLLNISDDLKATCDEILSKVKST